MATHNKNKIDTKDKHNSEKTGLKRNRVEIKFREYLNFNNNKISKFMN